MTRKKIIGIMCILVFAISFSFGIQITNGSHAEPPNPLKNISEEALNIRELALSQQEAEALQPAAIETPEEEFEEEQEDIDEENLPPDEEERTDEETPNEIKDDESINNNDDEQGDTSDEEGDNADEGEDGESREGPGTPSTEGGSDDGGESEYYYDEDPDDEDNPGEETDDPYIYTDLKSGIIAAEKPDEDTYALSFEAYIANGERNANLTVSWEKHPLEEVSGAGAAVVYESGTLDAAGNNYGITLSEGKYIFTFKAEESQASDITRVVTYTTNKNPPVIEVYIGTRLLSEYADGDNSTVYTVKGDNEQILVVKAWSGKTGECIRLSSSNCEVRLDGVLQSGSTGGTVWEQSIWLTDPDIGDSVSHTITVSVSDVASVSRGEYRVEFEPDPIGTVIGQATFILDCTAVDYGVLDSISVNILKGYPASFSLIAALGNGKVPGYEDLDFGCSGMGFGYDYDKGLGGPNGYVLPKDELGGFYLEAIRSGGLFEKAYPDDKLVTILRNSGYTLKRVGSADELREFDFTNDSGWMYFVNRYLPNRGFSDYYLSNGDVVTVCFTLAKGRDIGAAAFGESQFCYMWRNGSVTEISDAHKFEETERVEPSCETAGSVVRRCTLCGEEQIEELPATGHSKEETEHTDPTCETQGSTTYRCTRCGAERTEILPATGHHYADGVCAECGAAEPTAPPPEEEENP